MIHILTGEDITSSRNKLNELIKDKKAVRLDGKKDSIADIEMQLSSGNLFGDKKTIVIENFTRIKPAEKLAEVLLSVDMDVFLWDEADIPAKVKTAFKNAKSFSFTFPKFYYALLDGFIPGNKQLVQTLQDSLKTLEAEQVLYGLLKRVRQLIILKGNRFHEFSDFAKMQDWQLGKLRAQASKWSDDGLKNAFINLSELDEKIKTSGLTLDLSAHLDILLIRDLN